jgi:lysophospholipase L1-like esterase
VYYITPSATPPDHLSSVDGVHPDDYGYTLWARSLRGQLLPILKKYGIE